MKIDIILENAADSQINMGCEFARKKLAEQIRKEYMNRLLSVRSLLQSQSKNNYDCKRRNALQIIDVGIDIEIEEVCENEIVGRQLGLSLSEK